MTVPAGGCRSNVRSVHERIDERVCKSLTGLAVCCKAEYLRCVKECREDVPGDSLKCDRDRLLCLAPITQ